MLRRVQITCETSSDITGYHWIINLLLDVLMCSIAENFYKLFVFSLTLWACQNTTHFIKIPSDTMHQSVMYGYTYHTILLQLRMCVPKALTLSVTALHINLNLLAFCINFGKQQ